MSNSPTFEPELTYQEAAQFFGVSPRQVRRILHEYRKLAPALRYSYRNVRFRWSQLLNVAKARRAAALKGGAL